MTALTSREIAAMKALPAAIKAQNDAYTQGRLHYQEDSSAYTHNLRDESGSWIVASAPQSSLPHHEANMRRLAACWNACAGVPTETLEAAASWADIVKAPLHHRHHIPAEAAAVGAVLDPESLEQGDPS